MELIKLPRGTVEHLIVDISDRLKNLATLDSAGTRYDIRQKSSPTWVVQNATATTVGMTAYCLVDTTQSDYDVSARFELFVQFDNLPESPRLGPFEFEVNA